MSHDTQNPFSNENGEYLQELASSKDISKEKETDSKESALVETKRPYTKRK